MKRDTWIGFVPFYLLVAILFIGIAQGSSTAVTTASQNAPIERTYTIIIDAGHGGVDGGATSCSGVLEKQLNLEIALRLNDLMQLLGWQTKMIRTTDISVYTEGESIAAKKVSDLKQRVKIVNGTDNAILVSIHQNTFPSGKYSGAQVFYGPEQGSFELAKHLQETFIHSINPGSNRMQKKADGIYLLQHVNCPSVLVECGFISNQQEETLLRSEKYQQKISCVIASALSGFLLDSQTND